MPREVQSRNCTRKVSPAFQRRLDALLDRNGEGQLTASERRELLDMLDEVDRKTLLHLADLLLKQQQRVRRPARVKAPRPTKLAS
jgi:hypothetical protein